MCSVGRSAEQVRYLIRYDDVMIGTYCRLLLPIAADIPRYLGAHLYLFGMITCRFCINDGMVYRLFSRD